MMGVAERPHRGSMHRSPSGWFGQVMQRSDDGGQTWEPSR